MEFGPPLDGNGGTPPTPLPTIAVVIAGQSQGCNFLGPTQYTVRHSNLLALNIDDGTTQIAHEPLLGIGGTDSTFVAEMGDLLLDTGNYSRVVLAPIGVSATTAAQWATGGTYNSRITAVASQLTALGYAVGAVVWTQGEQDAVNGTSAASYETSMTSVISTFRTAGISAPFYIALETWANGSLPTGSSDIRTAQAALVNGTDVLQGPDLDTLDNSYRRDGTHFNDTGKSTVAGLWSDILSV